MSLIIWLIFAIGQMYLTFLIFHQWGWIAAIVFFIIGGGLIGKLVTIIFPGITVAK
ncbi:MAG: hypothetical protein GY814_20850 [Gammaproteobacteria bacterium]|nr:hypothetical protein [Gammaproteobacteria bacterium]